MKTFLPFFTALLLFLNQLSAQTLNLNFPSVNGQVYALAAKGDTLFIGGEFIEVDEIPRQNLAAIDLKTGDLLDWAPTSDGKVDCITVDENMVYICGIFQQVNQSDRNTLAAIDADDGTVIDWNPDIVYPGIPDFQTGRISGIAVSEGIIYLAGYYLSINGTGRNHLAALDQDGNLLSFNPAFDIPIENAEIHNNQLFVSGPFTQVGNQERISFAAFNLNTWTLTDWNPQANNPGNEHTVIFPHEDHIFIAGFFNTLGGTDRDHVAKVDAETAILFPWEVNFVNAFQVITSFEKWGDQIFMGGSYDLQQNDFVGNLVSLDSETGEYSGWWADPDDDVNALLVAKNKLIVGGNFTQISDQNKIGLAVYDLDQIIAVEELKEDEISIYPVPAHQELTILYSSDIADKIELYDMHGTLRLRQSVENTNSEVLDVQNMAAGMYQLMIRAEDGSIVKTKLIPVMK